MTSQDLDMPCIRPGDALDRRYPQLRTLLEDLRRLERKKEELAEQRDELMELDLEPENIDWTEVQTVLGVQADLTVEIGELENEIATILDAIVPVVREVREERRGRMHGGCEAGKDGGSGGEKHFPIRRRIRGGT